MNNHVTIGVVYTSTTPELIENVNSELRKAVGEEAGILEYQDPSILAEVREHGYVTPGAAARLVTMFMKAVSDGADVILNCCSSVGEAADAAQDIGRYTGIPIVRIDEEMCRAAVREAARTGGRIGVRIEEEADPSRLGYAPTLHMNLDTAKLRALGWEPSRGLADTYRRMILYMTARREI